MRDTENSIEYTRHLDEVSPDPPMPVVRMSNEECWASFLESLKEKSKGTFLARKLFLKECEDWDCVESEMRAILGSSKLWIAVKANYKYDAFRLKAQKRIIESKKFSGTIDLREVIRTLAHEAELHW